jgi:AbrB family transcriptional regulator (stage V sporulation protein T)
LKATGIVRRIDDLGRVVIPKEIRRTLRIREGDPLEIFTDREGEVILKKYSPIGELSDFAKEYVESLHSSMEHITCIADRDTIIAVAGAPKKELLDKRVSPALEKIMEDKTTAILSLTGDNKMINVSADEEGTPKYTAGVVAPIMTQGDSIGAVMILSRDPNIQMGELEVKLAETAASFLGKQMEQ